MSALPPWLEHVGLAEGRRLIAAVPRRRGSVHPIEGPGGLRRFLIDDAFRDRRQGCVGLLLLLQGGVQKPDGVSEPQLICPGLKRSVPGYLVVLDRLCGREETGIQRQPCLCTP